MDTLGNSDDAPAMVGKIIMITRQIEKQLHEVTGSDAAGIHALAEAAGNVISGETSRQLHYIGAVRNQAAHEADFNMNSDEFDRFLHTADAVTAALNRIKAGKAQTVARQEAISYNQPVKQSSSNYSSTDEENPYAVEKELFAKIKHNIMILGYYPFVGVFQLLFLLLNAMKKQIWVVFLSVIYICSVILAVEGWISEVHHSMLYIGVGCFVFAYICVSGMAIKMPIFRKAPKYLWLIPVVNIFYLPCRWAKDLQWKKFLTAFLGLSCFTTSAILLCNGYPAWSFFALIVSWICSVAGSYFWGKEA